MKGKPSLIRKLWLVTSMMMIVFVGHSAQSFALQADFNHFGQLRYRHIGPQGNRMIAVVGVPGDLNVYYAGAASGGIWKSIDGGANWKPIFDEHPVSSVGALAIAPSDTQIIWAGTGETFIRSNISIGNGIYKSADGGKTWKHMGLEKTGRIGRIVIDPHDSDIVFAAALGHCYGPQPDRGVFRTTDGGKTWEKVLFVDENTGCSDIAISPHDPRILFAGMWQMEIKTWGRWSGGPGSGVFISKDGGSTWKRLTGHGLPDPPLGKIAVAIAPNNPNRVYALIETKHGALWRSDDGGATWKLASCDHLINERPHYYTRVAVAPDNHNELYFPCVTYSVSSDGGATIETKPWGYDNHDTWIDPENPNRIAIAYDGGLLISTVRGQSWNSVVLPIAQMYHVAVDSQIPYFVYGNHQDGLAYRGPSNSLMYDEGWWWGGISSCTWRVVAGEECGFAIPDPVDNNIIWGSGYDGCLDRSDIRTNHKRSVRVWPESPMGWKAADLKYRFQWTFPIAISPHDHNRVYVGSQHVHQTTNGGQSWTVISPDLSTNDQTKLQDSGGITIDNLGVEYGCVIFAIAESTILEGLIWVGTNDGLVHVTRDGGASWSNVTANIPNLPPWGTISNVEPSKHDAGTCYMRVDLHQVNNRNPYIYKTMDYGKSWKSISSDIPRSVFSYAHCVREDPVRKGLLYVGTENALYVSFNDGANWIPLQANLPHAPVHWLVIQENFNDLVIATYGRGIWILDDITPFQQLTQQIINSDIYLFDPRPAYRLQKVLPVKYCPDDHCIGENPPLGASLNYYLKSTPNDDVKISIMDGNGKTIRTLKGDQQPGVNRVWWDLRYEPPGKVQLRTKPLEHPHVRFGPEGWRPLVSYGIKAAALGPLVAPGTYTVNLIVGEQKSSQKLIVKKDPNSTGSNEDTQAKEKLLLEIRESINSAADSINQIEFIRKQIDDIIKSLEKKAQSGLITAAAKELDKKLIGIEENLFQVHELAGGTQDAFRAPQKIYERLCMLVVDLGEGFGGTADFAPTDQQIEVFAILKDRLTQSLRGLKDLINKELPRFNRLLQDNNIGAIVVRTS